MRFPRLLAVFAVASLLVCAACGDTPADRPDSAVDAAVLDAAVDASISDGGVDAGLDAGLDASAPLDAGEDASLPDTDAGCTSNAACDDGDACTVDTCDLGSCNSVAVATDDGDICTVDACDPVTGVSHVAVTIDDGDACTVDACDPLTGVTHVALSIDDGNICTVDACDPATGIAHAPVSVDDGNGCTTDSCDPATGIAHTPVSVDDSNSCTTDSCAPATGTVTHAPLSVGTPCSEGGGVVCDGAGMCVAYPAVASTTPADGASTVASTSVAVTFTAAMTPATLTAQTAAGACTGSLQVSLDNFASCIALSSASPLMSGGGTVATLSAAPGLLVNHTYQVRVTTAAASLAGLSLGAQFTMTVGFSTQSPDLCAGSVVIAQVYGGGGNLGATQRNDYVVLHNRGAAPASLAGWSLQYASAAGTSWVAAALAGSIASGGYYLVQGASGGAAGALLPTADATTSSNLSGTAGKVALVRNTTALTVACPTGAPIVDFVGYGATACFEGATATPAPSNTTAVFRAQSACADVNDNGVDFAVGAPTPLNSASPAAVCSCAVLNESDVAAEADYCTVQFPLSLSVAAAASSGNVFGQVYELGLTEAAGASAAVRAQLGFGPATANPEYEAGWSWTNATYNIQVAGNDEYRASFTAPAAGSYRYAYRFSLDSGVTWTVCDENAGDSGAGSNAGLTFDLASLPVLTVP